MSIVFDDHAVVLCDESVLALADTHLGYISTFDAGNPSDEYAETTDRVETLILRYGPSVIVIAGDVFHEFRHPPDGAVRALQRMHRIAEEHDATLVVTPGNHDTSAIEWDIMADIATDEYTINECSVGILHGHERPTESADVYVVGHLHPEITIEGYDWPCYLYGEGTYRGSDVVILPSFSRLAGGVSVSAAYTPKIEFPILDVGDSLREYRPIVWDAETRTTRSFPRLRELSSVS